MTNVEKEKTIHERLVTIQQELKVAKSQHNNFGNYNYRSCEDILEAVKPLLDGLSLIINDEIVSIGERYYVKATAYLADGKDLLESTAYAREAENKKGMDEAQVTGATSSYARKYALNGLFAIDDTKDADTMDNKSTEIQSEPTQDGEITREPITDTKMCKNHNVALTKRYSEKKQKDYWAHESAEGLCFGY